MNNLFNIEVDIKDDELTVCDKDEDGIHYYSEFERRAFLKEIKDINCDDVKYDSNQDVVTVSFPDGKIVLNNFKRLKEDNSFKKLSNVVEKQEILEEQRQKLKSRKRPAVKRLAIFSTALMLSVPLILGATPNYNVNPYYVNSQYSIDNLDDMVLQGVCCVGDNTFLTAYDSSDENNNSIVYILDKDNNCIKETTLYNNSHVGGICYDSKHQMFWITDKGGTISGYSYDDILDGEDICYPKYAQVDVGSDDLINYMGQSSASYITYHDDSIFVGNFSLNGQGIVKKFSINDDGTIDLDSCQTSKFLDKVQGISFYQKDDDTYMLVSCSYGRFCSSELKILKYDENCKNYNKVESKDLIMPAMMEQISFDNDGNLVTLYESNAKKYQGIINLKSKKTSDVIVADINTIIR